MGSPALHHEQQRQDGDPDRQHRLSELGSGDLQALHRREHRDGRRDQRVAVEQRRAQHAKGQRDRGEPGRGTGHAADQRGERHDAALTVVVGPQDEGHVLDRHDQRDRPEDQRDDPEHVARRRADRVVVDREHRLHRIERAGTDVTENDTERAEGEPEQAAAVGSRMVGIAAGHSRLGC